MATPRVAEIAKQRLGIAARRLGTKNPVETIGGLLDKSFDLPLGDPRYGDNALLPGYLPLEHSFSETASGSLRIDMEPLGPMTSPSTRQHEVSREMRSLVHHNFGDPALKWFDGRSEAWRTTSGLSGAAHFGAWFGAAFDEGGLQEAKVYYELEHGRLDDLPANLQHAARVAMACLPGLVPIFTSLACGRQQGAQRVYFFHRGPLRLLDLEPLMNQLGVGHQLPGLLTALGLALGGRFTLPDGSVVLALRDTSRGMEMKLEVLLPMVADLPREMHGLVQMHLAQRPDSQRALARWLGAMTPENTGTPGDISVLSVRVTPQTGARYTLYFRPSGYDQAPSRARRPGESGEAVDPYSARGAA